MSQPKCQIWVPGKPLLQAEFRDYFDAVHDDEEAAATIFDDDVAACETAEDCFDKIGDERLDELYEEFIRTLPPDLQLYAMSRDCYDTED